MTLFTSISTVRKYIVVCLSISLLTSIHVFGCGPDFTGFQYSLLLEHYSSQHKFYPYQYDPYSTFYSFSWGDGEQPDNRSYNVALWRSFLKLSPAVDDSDLIQFIYQNSHESLANFTKQGPAWNNILNRIREKENSKEVMEYLHLMNEYKEHVIRPQDVWNYETYTDSVSMDTVKPFIAKCEKLIKKSIDDFIRWRSLYLILRAAHFNRYYELAIEKFDELEPGLAKSNSLEEYWCEGVYAGALLRAGQENKAIYYTARAFANCPDQHQQAMATYLYSHRNWKSALPYCKNANDSVYVATLEGAHHVMPNMEFIKMVYSSNPQSDMLKLLWLREAMKVQLYLQTPDEVDGRKIMNIGYNEVDINSLSGGSTFITDFLSMSELALNYPKNLAVKATVAHCMAFYYYKKGEYDKASTYIDKASKLSKDDIETIQYDLLNQLITLKKNQEVNSQNLMNLMNVFKNIQPGLTNRHIGYYMMHNDIAPWLLERKDSSAAFWSYVYANSFEADSFDLYSWDYSPESFGYSNFATYLLNQHFSIKEVHQLKQDFLHQKGKTAIETALIKGCKLVNGVQLFDLVIARKHMLNEDWDKALALFNNLPSSFTNKMGSNPANFYINDYIEDDSSQATKNTFTVKRIMELASKLKSLSATSARDKLLYATLLYNLSYYGKNHYVLDYHWYHSQSSLPYFNSDSVNTYVYYNNQNYYSMPLHPSYQNYFHLQTAEKILNDALPGLSSNEEKAQCLFLMAKCWQKRCPTNTQTSDYEENYVSNSVKNPYFQNLADYFGQTETEDQIFNSCSYYKMYLGKR